YMDELMRLKEAAKEEGNKYLTWNDIQACIDQVNLAVQEEHERIAAIGQINESLDEGDPMKTLDMLQNPSAKLTDVDPSIAQHYHDKLLEARREKAHVSQEVIIQIKHPADGFQQTLMSWCCHPSNPHFLSYIHVGCVSLALQPEMSAAFSLQIETFSC
ncbi:Ras GTPase-activating-like protein iqgap1, partial [Goodea atripinnis]